MAKKKTTTVIEEDLPEEGIREAGEPLPQDDSHIVMGDTSVGDGEEGSRDTQDEEQEQLVSITVGGQEMQVPQATADAYQAEQEANRYVPEPSSEPAAEATDDTVDYEQLLFTDPNRALALLSEQIRTQVTSELRGEYSADTAQREFWGSFYKENKELSEDDHIVRMVMTQNWDTLEGMKGKVARDKLAELTQREILRLVKKNRSSNPPSGGSADLEGGTNKTSSTTSKEQSDEPTADAKVFSLGEAIKQRKLDRSRSNRTASN